MNWYLIHTKPRLEQVALQNLQQQGFECYLPLLTSEKLRRGKLVLVEEPLFPRYLFIHLGTGTLAKSWSPIRSTIGVSRMVSFGSDPAKLSDALIDALRDAERSHQQEPLRLFRPGDLMVVTKGAFAGIEAVYQMTDGEKRVMVLINILSKSVKLRIEPDSLRKLTL
jgi:transcriptional antiterminator RfaH